MEIATLAATVLAGIVVFLFGQFIVVLYFERIRVQARCVEGIAEALVMYANVYTDIRHDAPSDWERERNRAAGQEFRRLAALLRANTQTLRHYRFWRLWGLVLPKGDVVAASVALIGLSNQCPASDFNAIQANEAASGKIKRLLRFDVA